MMEGTNMFRTLLIHITPKLALFALAMAGLVRPGTSLAQTSSGNGALLNRTAMSIELRAASTTISPFQIHDEANAPGGERALQGRGQTPRTSVPQLDTPLASTGDPISVNGERALQGRWSDEKLVSNLNWTSN
jgi:hypothetical protein